MTIKRTEIYKYRNTTDDMYNTNIDYVDTHPHTKKYTYLNMHI